MTAILRLFHAVAPSPRVALGALLTCLVCHAFVWACLTPQEFRSVLDDVTRRRWVRLSAGGIVVLSLAVGALLAGGGVGSWALAAVACGTLAASGADARGPQ